MANGQLTTGGLLLPNIQAPNIAAALGRRDVRERNQLIQQRQDETFEMTKALKKFEFRRKLLKGVVDQASLDRVIATERQVFPPSADDPGFERLFPGGKFDAETVKQLKAQVEEAGKKFSAFTAQQGIFETGTGKVIREPGEAKPKAFKPPETVQLQNQVAELSKDPQKNAQRIKNLNARISKLTAPTEKAGKSFILPNNQIVQSFDGGRTFIDETGKSQPLAGRNALPVTGAFTGADFQVLKAKEQANKQAILKGTNLSPIRKRSIKQLAKIAKGGTGPWNMLAAAIDATLGGLGLDRVFGKEGFFQDTQKNRQILRNIRQLGKSAFLNSSRGAIWEQRNIQEQFPNPDTFFTNPATEALKFNVIRENLRIERVFNNTAIQSGITAKEVSDLRRNNLEIDRLLALIGEQEQPEGAIPTFNDPSDPGFNDLKSGDQFFDSNGKLRVKR